MVKYNIQKISLFSLMVFALSVVFPVGNALATKSNPDLLEQVNKPSSINLMLGKAEMVDLNGSVADVLVADPNVADVMAVKSNRLYVVGSALGSTNIIALDSQGNVIKKINVHVQMDVDKLVDMIGALYPNENVKIRALTDQLVLTGDVSTPDVANKITTLVSNYAGEIQGISASKADDVIVNMLGVQGARQVMLRVKIVEASRSALKDLGLELNSNGGGGIGNLAASFVTSAALGLTAPAQLAAGTLGYNSGDLGAMSFIARALEQEGILNTLAEPNLTAISGEQAGFLAGGEFPIPTNLDQNGNLVYEFRPFGVSLNFKPVVMSKDRISLQINTEVSTTSFDQNLQLNGVNVPTFNVRRADTTVELPSGGTLMIAGLIQSESISGLTQLPGIGDIPVVGDLIKSDTFKRNESEVIVMITPYLIEPFAQNQSKIAPSKEISSVTGDNVFNGAYMSAEDTFYIEDDNGLPVSHPAERSSSSINSIFSDNIRRIYGKKAPTNMLDQTVGYGYLLE